MLFLPRRGFGKVAEEFSQDASCDPVSRWCGGVLSALIPVVLGLMAIVTQHAYFVNGRPLRITEHFGAEAIALGIACLGVGLLMHAHYFWSGSQRFYILSEILKPIALLTIIGSFGYFIVNQFLFG